jgi:hypothetical protein
VVHGVGYCLKEVVVEVEVYIPGSKWFSAGMEVAASLRGSDEEMASGLIHVRKASSKQIMFQYLRREVA